MFVIGKAETSAQASKELPTQAANQKHQPTSWYSKKQSKVARIWVVQRDKRRGEGTCHALWWQWNL